ncbi:hypothetical protein EDB84DRAFT_1268649 [Lactarius hengduanensis]|nr:hypothetical protein EDB84DRAFT_1268649 [Lactarius hengduanensis]
MPTQFVRTPAYAFTDIKSQGQTLECVFVDITKPPSGSLTDFNADVALSRSRGCRNTIRLLRNFDERTFTVHPNEQLQMEDERLAALESTVIQRYKSGEFGERLKDITPCSQRQIAKQRKRIIIEYLYNCEGNTGGNTNVLFFGSIYIPAGRP